MPKISTTSVFVFAVIACVLAVGIESGTEYISLALNKAAARADEAELLPSGADDHSQLRTAFDTPGFSNPQFFSEEESDLDPSTTVVGIEVNGEAVAFPLQELEKPHIVNSVIQGQALSVTYCTLANCVRVLAQDSQGPIDLRIGGQDNNMQMVFLYQGSRFAQESKKLPLQDYPFTRCSLAQWKKQHPKTQVFQAPKKT